MAATPEIVHLAVQGLACPLPLLRARQAIAQLLPGQTLQITGVGADSVTDLQHLCQEKGLAIELQKESEHDLSSMSAMVSKILF
jgi:tRNA 2-thiouridine synthesizing protein A